MENYQKLEQIVEKTGCSYEDARAALEGCGWDMIDAVISLEKEGKISRETAESKEEPVDDIPEVTLDVKKADAGSGEKQDGSGNAGSGAEDSPKRKMGLWTRIKRILMNNRMLVFRSNGQKIIDLPILAPIIALIAFFWATLIIAAVAMVFGYRFHFEGDDLGKTNINSTMDKATDYAEKVKNEFKEKTNGK